MSINRRRITLSLAANVFFEGVNKISPFLILYHAHKSLGLADFGNAQYQLALLESVQPFIVYGFPNFAMSHPKTDDTRSLGDLVSQIFLLKCFNGLLVLIFFLLQQGPKLDLISTGLLLLVLLACILDAYWVCIVRHKLMWLSLAGGAFRLVSLALIWFYVRNPSDLPFFLLFSLLPSVLMGFCTGFFALSQISPVRLRWQRKALSQVYLAATPYALLILGITLFERLDILLVQYWYGADTSGIYGGPARITLSLSMLLSSLALPFFAETRTIDDPDSLYQHISLSLSLLSVVVAPLIFGLPFTESLILPYVLPEQPASAHGLLGLLCVGLVGSILQSVFGVQLLLAKGRVWKLIVAVLIGIMVTLSVSFAVRHKDYFAIGQSMVIGKIAVGMITVFFARSLISKFPFSRLLKPFCAGAGMGALLWVMSFDDLFTNLLGGALVYLTLLAILFFQESKDFLLFVRRKKANLP